MSAIKDIIRVLTVVCIVVVFAGCSRPKTINDENLESIFKEIYLANALCDVKAIVTDSIDIYAPILKKYGYTQPDMLYTIKGFTKRKSSRLSDIIDNAIKQLDAEYAVYEGRVAVLDTIDVRVGDMYKQIVYKDSIIIAKKVRDTSRLRITIPVKQGRYKVEYSYFIDSLEENTSLKATHNMYDKKGVQTNYSTNWMNINSRKRYSAQLDTKPGDTKLVLLFANYPRKDMKRPDLRIDSLVVTYYFPKQVARDSVNKSFVDYKLLIDGQAYTALSQDSCARRVHPPRIPVQRDSIR